MQGSDLSYQAEEKMKLYQVAVVVSGALDMDCRVRVFEVLARGRRDAIALAHLLVESFDEEHIEAISSDIVLGDEGFDAIEVLAVRGTERGSTAHAWTREEIELYDPNNFVIAAPPSPLLASAHHEAGHAFVGHRKGFRVREVYISGQADTDVTVGYCRVGLHGHEDLGDLLMYTLAGAASDGACQAL
jgi:hypothetical protein